jgi:hypothetical protein
MRENYGRIRDPWDFLDKEKNYGEVAQGLSRVHQSRKSVGDRYRLRFGWVVLGFGDGTCGKRHHAFGGDSIRKAKF